MICRNAPKFHDVGGLRHHRDLLRDVAHVQVHEPLRVLGVADEAEGAALPLNDRDTPPDGDNRDRGADPLGFREDLSPINHILPDFVVLIVAFGGNLAVALECGVLFRREQVFPDRDSVQFQ